jgi:NAD(P)-dependent dehydrogenase (short-subunit alcohol dehydrogenase family)
MSPASGSSDRPWCVAAFCRRAGSQALAVETDVTDEEAVGRLATKSLEVAGRIDVWVNNAGVTVFAPLDEGPFEPHRRVIETNLYGAMFGARAVLPIFKRQHAGILINVSSVLGPGMLLWGAGHLVRGLWRKRSRRSSLRPHSSS